MSVLEPRACSPAEDPVRDLVLGLYASSRRCRATIERLAPEVDEADGAPLPEPFVHVLLGAIAVSKTIERCVEKTMSVEPPPAPRDERASARTVVSLWR